MPSLLNRLNIRNLSQRIIAPVDEFWDRRLGVHTFGYNDQTGTFGDPDWCGWFVSATWTDILRVLDAAEIGPDDVFTDLGSGTGRAVFAASWRGAKRAVGVERVGWLAAAAQENHRDGRLKHRNINFIEADAREVSLVDSTIVYLFHSFGHGILQDVLDRLYRERQEQGVNGRLRLCYMNPIYEDMLDATPWLRPFRTLPPRREWVKGVAHYVTRIWETI